jgi:hypothetical protein
MIKIHKEHLTIKYRLPGDKKKTKKYDGPFYADSKTELTLPFDSLPMEEWARLVDNYSQGKWARGLISICWEFETESGTRTLEYSHNNI